MPRHISHGEFRHTCRGSTEMSQQVIFVDHIAFGGGGEPMPVRASERASERVDVGGCGWPGVVGVHDERESADPLGA